MATTTTLSFRTEVKTREQIDKMAELLDRDRSWVINEAVGHYLELQAWQLQQIEEGIRELDAGKGYTLEEVRDRFAKLSKVKSRKRSR
jgi:RHH-type transcriptional regulator, rel operon repressor / antitoxin RelB